MFSWLRRWPYALYDSLLGRIVLVLVLGVSAAQIVGTLVWSRQLRESARTEALNSGKYLAVNASGAIRFLTELPPSARPNVLEQMRKMGGARFFVAINPERLPVIALPPDPLADAVLDSVRQVLVPAVGAEKNPDVAFSWPQDLQVGEDTEVERGERDAWMLSALPVRERSAPVLVIQSELEPGHWLYMAAPMPDPYFLENANPYSTGRIVLQGVTLLTVLLLAVLMVRWLIRPINRIAQAANAFGSANASEPIPETGTAELRRTARAFNEMQARIQGYLLDRERLFGGISHSLKTPIMRLKLRTELLDDEVMRAEFHEDLDDLDVMVGSALQSLRETDIHENLVALRIDSLLDRLVRRPIYPNASIAYVSMPIRVLGKPLALERALGNLLDNGVLYGQRVQVRVSRFGAMAMVEIRDFGPGIPAASMSAVFEPQVRLNHGQQSNRGGTGLGMGISRNIIQAHGGEIRLHNHLEGGLVVTVLIPALPSGDD